MRRRQSLKSKMFKRTIKLGIALVYGMGADLGAWILKALGRSVAPRLIILYYHAVPSHQRAAFARQMDRLSKTAHPAHAHATRDALRPGLNAAVTFDDAFESVAENALPELARRKIPCTIFVPTGYVGRRPQWAMACDDPDREERVMDEALLRSLVSDEVVLASHSVRHLRMTDLAGEERAFELIESRRRLQEIVKRPVTLFSFPHGAHDDDLLERARRAGYERVFTITPRKALRRVGEFATGRFSVSPADWPIEFRLKLKGAYAWQPILSRLKRRIMKNGKRKAQERTNHGETENRAPLEGTGCRENPGDRRLRGDRELEHASAAPGLHRLPRGTDEKKQA